MKSNKRKKDQREKYLLKYIKNKKALDLGAADIRANFLHRFIATHSTATGLDIDPERIKQVKNMGYKVVLGDAQNYNLKEKFDVIIAGEIIEHLTNLDGFLKSARKNLKKEGLLIITTPNVFSLYRRIGFRKLDIPFEEHTCWFCANTLKQLLVKYDFTTIRTIYYDTEYNTFKGKIINLLFKYKPKLHSNIMIICIKK